MIIEEIEMRLKKGKLIEDILQKYDWKKFESIVSEIFLENGFHTKQNFRFKTKRRYEIDVMATRNSKIFCIDCKWWNKGRYKKSGLKQAVSLQENRAKELGKFLKKNTIARSLLKINSKYTVHSLLVTLNDEDMIHQDKTVLIPIWKLNKFIMDSDGYF